MVVLQDAQSVVSSTWDQFQSHPVKTRPISKSRALMWATGIQPEMGRKSKRPHPGRFQQRNFHIGRLLNDAVVHLVSRVLIEHRQHPKFLAIPLHTGGADGNRVVEVGALQSVATLTAFGSCLLQDVGHL